jgi:cytochrome c5
MSQHHADSGNDTSKGNPLQLAVAVTAGALGLIIAIVMVAYFAVGTHKVGGSEAKANSPEAIAQRIAPLTSLPGPDSTAAATPTTTAAPTSTATATPAATPAKPDKVAAGAGSGEGVYKTVCMACHAAGVANAPKLGDKAAWAPRIAKGKPMLYDHALKGFNNVMPAKGGNAALADADVKAAVDYMLAQAK